jgi:hypothetical protein
MTLCKWLINIDHLIEVVSLAASLNGKRPPLKMLLVPLIYVFYYICVMQKFNMEEIYHIPQKKCPFVLKVPTIYVLSILSFHRRKEWLQLIPT